MSEAVVVGVGGGKSEGKFAWKKEKQVIAIGEYIYERIETPITLYDALLIDVNGDISFDETTKRTETVSADQSYVSGFMYRPYIGIGHAEGWVRNNTGGGIGTYAASVSIGTQSTAFIINDDPNKFPSKGTGKTIKAYIGTAFEKYTKIT